jgi:hypothetical protein
MFVRILKCIDENVNESSRLRGFLNEKCLFFENPDQPEDFYFIFLVSDLACSVSDRVETGAL